MPIDDELDDELEDDDEFVDGEPEDGFQEEDELEVELQELLEPIDMEDTFHLWAEPVVRVLRETPSMRLARTAD